MHPYIQESASQNTLYGTLQVGVGAYDGTVLSTELHQTRLEILAAYAGDLAPHGCAASEVDFADGRVLDHGIDHLGSILRAAG